MRKGLILSFLIICMAGILAAGCTNTASTNAPLTPTPEIIYVTVTPSPVATVVATLPTPQVTPVPSLATSGIRQQIRSFTAGFVSMAIQLRPSRPVMSLSSILMAPWITEEGTTKEVSSNIIIDTTYNFSEETGTWTSLGNMTYLVKVLPHRSKRSADHTGNTSSCRHIRILISRGLLSRLRSELL